MVRLLNNMRNIVANKKLTREEQLNLISKLQIHFDKIKKNTGILSGAIPPQVALEAPPAAWPVQPKVIADNGIKSNIETENKEQYVDVQEDKYMSNHATALSSQME